MPVQRVTDSSDDKKYFFLTPQIVWARSRDPYDFTLWNVIKMVAGELGECFLSTDQLATLAMMSTGKVSECRCYLIQQGLLVGELRQDPGYPQPVWHLQIPNLWKANLEWREGYDSLRGRIELKKAQKSLHQVKPSPGEEGLPPGEEGLPPGETKKNHKEEPKEKPHEGAAPKNAPPAIPDYLDHVFAGATETPPAGVADPTQDPELWLNYRDQALAAYKELTGLYPDNQVGKPAISNLSAEAGWDLERWRKSITSCRLGGVNPRNIQCMIDTYRDGGDYRQMIEKRNGGKNGRKTEREDTRDAIPDTSGLTDEQRRLVRRYREPQA